MKKKIISVVACILMLISIFPMSAFAGSSDDIVILYENDVHCAVEGYSTLSAMKEELEQTYSHVGAVSCGDYIQGTSLGVVSKGEYIINLMNLVGYDAVTLGNHEFDFRIERLKELIGKMNTKPVCCNFQEIGSESSYFNPYSIVSYGEIDIAYIGITTPETTTSSSPSQFKDEDGNFIYTFNHSELYDVIQKNIDDAEAEGADYIIALSHIGYADDEEFGDLADVETLIRNTSGFDVVLDGHSHSVIESKRIEDKDGKDVLLSSTGTNFEHIGKLTISNGNFETELIKTADYTNTDPAVDSYIEQIYADFSTLGERKVATSEVKLNINDDNGNRLVRNNETNLGDFVADAYRYAVNADIGYVNGGGLRANILKGDVTFNDLLNVHPYNNKIVLGEVSGQTIKDMMEMAVRSYPAEEGAFPHVSGLKFSVNTSIPSSVVLNEQDEFIGVDGQYRVYNVKVFNKETDCYEPIDLDAKYTLSASNYNLIECGSGMKMLENAKILQNEGMLDVEALEMYISEALGGVIGEDYSEMKENIFFTDGEIPETDENEGQSNIDNNQLVNYIISVIHSFFTAAFAFFSSLIELMFS